MDDLFYKSEEWQRLRYRVLRKNKVRCFCCGRTPQQHNVVIHVDHVKPRSKFPELELDINNLQLLCEDCNLGKRNTDSIDWTNGKRRTAKKKKGPNLANKLKKRGKKKKPRGQPDRDLLPRGYIKEFTDWLRKNDIEYRDGRGPTQALQIRLPGENWLCVHRKRGNECYSTHIAMRHIVIRFTESMGITIGEPSPRSL